MKHLLTFETTTAEALSSFLNSAAVQTLHTDGLCVSLDVAECSSKRGFGLGEIMIGSLEIANVALIPIATNLIASWLYESLRGRVRRVEHRGDTFTISREELSLLVDRMLEEQMDKKQTSTDAAKRSTSEEPSAGNLHETSAHQDPTT